LTAMILHEVVLCEYAQCSKLAISFVFVQGLFIDHSVRLPYLKSLHPRTMMSKDCGTIMTDKTFVILAAGQGTRIGRVGESLHKALVPLNGRAILSHLIALAPLNSKLVICIGHRGEQLQNYMALAHPQLNVTWAQVDNWDRQGSGPGTSLLAARPHVTGDMVFTSCDTLWQQDQLLWWQRPTPASWIATAPIPAGTPPARWCRVSTHDGVVTGIYDKSPGGSTDELAYTGLSCIVEDDLEQFWSGFKVAGRVQGEVQVSGGLQELLGRLHTRDVHWTDVGDEASYRRAVAKWSGYDWTKLNEATYVLPEEGRVVKFWSDSSIAQRRARRAINLGPKCVPQPVFFRPGHTRNGGMISYTYVPGVSGYAAADIEGPQFMHEVLRWHGTFARAMDDVESVCADACMQFYRGKTLDRVNALPVALGAPVFDALSRINWEALAQGGVFANIHGDLNYGNIVARHYDEGMRGIDWREDFAGHVNGDLRYDYAKLLAGTVVHWERAQRGDFRPWAQGEEHANVLRHRVSSKLPSTSVASLEIIGALSLLSSAPLHAAPLDEILVARALDWLESL
jgi:dTDP-glucose pyrophosphorylase